MFCAIYKTIAYHHKNSVYGAVELNLTFRKTEIQDLGVLVAMLANDAPGAKREQSSVPLNPAYLHAFEAIDENLPFDLESKGSASKVF